MDWPTDFKETSAQWQVNFERLPESLVKQREAQIKAGRRQIREMHARHPIRPSVDQYLADPEEQSDE